jgi:4-hydroxyproline epimerase
MFGPAIPMCGHGTIGTVTAAVEEGLVVPGEPGKLALGVPACRMVLNYEMYGP